MGCHASSTKEKSQKGKGAVVNKYKARAQDGELLNELSNVSIVDVVNNAGVSGPKTFVGAKNDPSPIEMKSFTNKCVESLGDAIDLLPKGIAFTCRKGLKPDTPNQDTWFVLKMETFSLYGVLDGHGPSGHEVSQFVKEYLPKLIVQDPRSKSADVGPCLTEAFTKMQRLVKVAEGRRRLMSQKSGTTATVALLDHSRSKLTLAHVADSAAAVAVKEGDKWVAKSITRDHKPNTKGEKERIEKAGATVGFDGTNHRVYAKDSSYPGLNMSRCFGDTLGHEECGIICEPEITRITLDRGTEQILLICSDGVWEFMSAQEAIDIVTSRPYDMGDQAVALLAKASWDRWIREEKSSVVDDITAGLIYIGKEKQ